MSEPIPLRKPEEPQDPKKLSWLMKVTFSASFFAALLLSGYWFYWNSRYISTEDAYVEADLSPVNSRMMGFISEIDVAEHDEVQKDQRLLKFDDVDSRLELSYKLAKQKKALADGERARKMHAQHAISDSDYEMAEAALAGINTEVKGGELKLKFTEILAPATGIVAKKTAQVGQFVQPGQTLFVIVPTDHAWIKANFKETQISRIEANQKVDIKVDAYPGEIWAGHVDYVYPSSVASLSLIPPENATGNFTKVVQRFPVHISFEPKEGKPLRPGMSVEVVARVR